MVLRRKGEPSGINRIYRLYRQEGLTALIERRVKPEMIVSDNGTELSSDAILRWCSENRTE